MILLTLDPSKNDVGYSVFNTAAKKPQAVWRWGTWKLEGHNLEMRMFDLVQKIAEDIGHFDYLCTERPAFFSSERGQIAAHMNYTIDLAAISFYVAGWYHMDHRTHFAITANQWKGTVKKAITARRFFRRFPNAEVRGITDHAIDATMLGVFCIETVLINVSNLRGNTTAEELLKLV